MRIEDKDDGTIQAAVDAKSRSLGIIEVLHRRIHNGDAFEYSVSTSLASSTVVDGSDAYNVTLRTGATKESHLTFSVLAGGSAFVELYRGSSISGNGTAVIPENLDEGSTKVSSLTVLTNSSSTGTTGLGTQRFILGIPGSELVGNRLLGGGGEGRNERIISTASTNVFRVSNGTTASISLVIGLSWYEVETS